MEFAFVPQSVLALFNKDKSTQSHLNVLFSSAIVILALLVWRWLPTSRFVPHVCLAQYMLHVPCPGCGITSSLVAFSRLDLRAAWRANPIGPFLGIFLSLQVPARTVAIALKNSERAVNWLSSVASRMLVAGLILVWISRVA